MCVRRLTFLAILAAIGALGGCGNVVHSEKPLFGTADESGAPAFRQGVWIGEDPDCRFDDSRPMADWPKCADPMILGPLGLKDPKIMDGAMDRVVAGDPVILQVGDRSGYSYMAVRATRTDRRGRITALEAWPAMCGPPPPADAADGAPPRKVTREPLPGLEIAGDDCLARERSAVRRSVKASEAWFEPKMAFHWVRAAEP